jgi:hypothetical protein
MKTLDDVINASLAELKAASAPEARPPESERAAAGARLLAAGYRPFDRVAFAALCDWLAGAWHDADRRRKGLWLFGKAGTGKTLFCRLFVGEPVPASVIVNAYRERRSYDDGFWHAVCGVWDGDQSACRHLCIDDLGQEPACVSFGQREEVLDYVLTLRHGAWQRHGVLTSVTSNLDPAALDRRYGRRITDRLREMCVPVEFRGESNRQ